MGGMGSGARRTTHVGNVEGTLALDIRALRRLEVVRAGECVCDTVRWSIDAERAPSVRLRVDLSDIERGGATTITGDMPDGTINQHIAINAVPSAFGGWRCYFICPVTARRCEIIYYADGRFASRQGQRLSYVVQGMTDLGRARRRAAKLHRRLQGGDALPRPRGQNRIEVAKRLHEARIEVRALYHARLTAMVDNATEKRPKGGSAIRRIPSGERPWPKDT